MQREGTLQTIKDHDSKILKKREIQSSGSQTAARIQNQGNINRHTSGALINPSELANKTREELIAIRERGKGLLTKKRSYKKPLRNGHLPSPIPNDEKTPDQLKMEKMQRLKDIEDYQNSITYSRYYYDCEFEYRHVILPKEIARWLPHHGLLSDEEWRMLGISQSIGWIHYMVHAPEPHILLFKREKHFKQNLKISQALQNEQETKKTLIENQDGSTNAIIQDNKAQN